jgi:GntR family transcriptional regulator
MLRPMSNEHDVKRTPGTALHRQIFLVLKDGIAQGSYAPGTALPKEESLVQLFGVSRATVRRALADLELEGLVLRKHGLGTFVREGLATGAKMATLSFVDELRHTAQSTEVRVVTLESSAPPAAVRSFLQVPDGEPVVHAIRVRMAGKVPLMITETWVPQDLGKSITAAALKRSPMYEVLNGQGVKFGRVVQEISAESADPHRAALLKCELSTALIRMSRIMHDQAGRPVMYVTAHLTPQHSRILMEIPGDAIDTLSAGHIIHDPALVGNTAGGGKRQKA